ncbi:MAG: beta-propeller domain-containing protein [Candidatus Micrarchaeia archaeon]
MNLVIALAIFSIMLVAGCTGTTQKTTDQIPSITKPSELSNISQPLAQINGLKKFSSLQEMNAWMLQSSQITQTNSNSGTGAIRTTSTESFGMEKIITAISPSAAPTDQSMNEGSVAGSDYSQTNVQIAGIDEADFVKTDGKYIYLIEGNELIIVDAQNPKEAKIVSRTKIPDDGNGNYGQANQMFVQGKKLVLFAGAQKKSMAISEYDITPYQKYDAYTIVYTYDISDVKNPKISSNISISGSYYQSRMMDKVVYVITQQSPGGYYENVNGPQIYQKDAMITPEIYYFDDIQSSYQLNTIASISVQDEKVLDAKTFLLGYSSTMMMSDNNIYLAYQNQYWGYCRWCKNNQGMNASKRFYDVMLPLLPQDVQAKILPIKNGAGNDEQKWQEIEPILMDFMKPAYEGDGSLLPDAKKQYYTKLVEDITDALAEYDAKYQIANTKTTIYKLGVKNGQISYSGAGSVPGYLVNQFAMDEKDSNLRVATTVDVWAAKHVQYNNVYVLDSSMKTIGSLEVIAQDEKIYSARFMGDRLYLVTYKQVDPFFVIDLSDAKNPEILGALKLPGYSQYLHPFEGNIIIGIGKETGESEWGTTSTKGVKAALFDVTNPANPKLIDSVEIGDSGSDSAVLHDHKAFLLDAKRGLMVLPVTEVETSSGLFNDKTKTWNGAYVFNISKNGFDEVGKVEHSLQTGYFGWWDSATVQRSIYIGDELYTISNKYIKVNEIAPDMPNITSISLPAQESAKGISAALPSIDIEMPVIR